MIRTRTRRARLAALMLGLSAAVASAPAAAERHAVALKAGLLGLGLDYAYSPVERWALRVGVNRTQFGFDAEESGIDYDFDLVFDSTSLAIDFHPTRGALRLS